ncbi:preprotein translocase subunit YajC [Novosphingobium beihaiensis]|uniref:Preprotein translocase subunit YajC n=1 Tax=Novosphingobium beihaiensis TaxID=2930389 RepID=A0ABT0BQZ8_9SPHN|nr:preprotein translocase subunit YajC [Novosphingobium beihaiensis]MCJ2187293.1 preprotein translocase subunit YajC [Novosphingobium beihaiensis]
MTGVTQMRQASIGRRLAAGASLAALAVFAVPGAAQAQSIGYDGVGSSAGGAGGGQDGSQAYQPPQSGKSGKSARRGGKGSKRLEVTPYIEIDQVADAQISPGNDVLTYTQVAAGIDAGIAGRNNGASVSLRYERQFGWGKKTRDGDAISGVARGYTTIVPGVTVEAGGLATRASFDGRGGSVVSDKSRTDVYSVYGGPSVATRAGAVNLSANYRAGFTKVDQSNDYAAGGSTASANVFDKSVTQAADAEAGVAPGDVLPVGLGVGGNFYQEDISNLDQRVRNVQAQAMVTVPVSRTVQAVGSIGYEDVEVSSRDALRDADGNPVIGSDGRYKTDKSAPRVLAYDVSGLSWDVAVMWRPSHRTSLSAHVGRRYGATNFGGTLAYAPNDRSQLSVAVYNNVAGYGGQLNRLIDELPDDFEAVRDPVTGELTGCVSSLDGNNCLSGALGSLRSSVFRARGVSASYAMRIGRLNAGIGLGYDQRKFIAAQGTVLASANGVIDENYWLSAYLSGQLGENAGWSTNAYAAWLSSNDGLTGDANNYGLSASYYRLLTRRLHARLAVAIDGTTRDDPAIDDIWTASALAGLRYNF